MTNNLKYLLLLLLLLQLRGMAQPCISDSTLIPVDSTVRIGHLENGLIISSDTATAYLGRGLVYYIIKQGQLKSLKYGY